MSEESIINQNNYHGKNGGVRPRAGRPVGSSNKPKLLDYMSMEEREEYMKHYLAKAKQDNKVLCHLVDQMLGKAPQSMDLRAEIANKIIQLE